jgi:hypothetical protein
VEGIEDKRGFTGAAEAGNDDIATEGKVEVEALKVILADAAQTNTIGRGTRNSGGSG